jgi:hypothetical protein
MDRMWILLLVGVTLVLLGAIAAVVVRLRPGGRHRQPPAPGRRGFIAAGVAAAAAVGAGAWAAHLITRSDTPAHLDVLPPVAPGAGIPANDGAPGGPPATANGHASGHGSLTAIANVKTTGEQEAAPRSTTATAPETRRPSPTRAHRRAVAESGASARAWSPSSSASSHTTTEPADDDTTRTEPSRHETPRSTDDSTDHDSTSPSATSTDSDADTDERSDHGPPAGGGRHRSQHSSTPEDDRDGRTAGRASASPASDEETGHGNHDIDERRSR